MLSLPLENINGRPLESEVKILFEIDSQKVEFVNPITCNATWMIDNGFALKKVSVEAIGNAIFKDLIVELSDRKRIMTNVFIGGVLFVRSWLTQGMINYYLDKSNGVIVEFSIFDRFLPLKVSDIIKTKPAANTYLRQFIGNILFELGFTSEEFIDTYQRKITKAHELIKNGVGVEQETFLKTFSKEEFISDSGRDLVGDSLSLCGVMLISNGYDTLTIERPNANRFIIGHVDSKADSNIVYFGKVGEKNSEEAITPSTVIILNSRGNETSASDNNTAVIAKTARGLPNIIKISNVSFSATHKQIASMLDYNFAGIKAKQDSFLIKINGVSLTSSREFFQPNRRINVFVPELGIDEDMVILQMGMNISAQQGTELVLNVSTESSFEDNATLRQKIALMR